MSDRSGTIDPDRDGVVTARERHAWCRADGMGYPGRALRTRDWLYIRNYEPDRWPGGDPPLFGDVDAHMLQYPCATKRLLLAERDNPDIRPFFESAFMKRPAEELYDIHSDPGQLRNLAAEDKHRETLTMLSGRLEAYLRKTGDPRVLGNEIIWDSTRYYQEIDFHPKPDLEAIEQLGLDEEYSY